MTHRIFYVVSGVILIAGGILALFLPVAASLAATLIVGWTFVIAGILHIIAAFRDADERLWNAGFGIVALLLGASFIANPLSGMISLTIVLGALFLGSGVLQLWLAWKRREKDSVLWLALSGVVSIALAVLIAMNLFAAATTVPGILLAIEMITTGLGLLLLREKLAPVGDLQNGETAPTDVTTGPSVVAEAKPAPKPAPDHSAQTRPT